MPGNILLERSLPLSWSVLPPQATPPATEHNQLLLALLDNLEEPTARNPEGESSTEWVRVEAKLNIIMQLLGQLLQSRQPLPDPVAIRFTSDSLAWQVSQAPPPTSLLSVAVYPEASLPLAIHFVARVQAISGQWMEVDMHGLNEEQQAMWSRWIFRQHRRQVAQARTQFPDQRQPD